MKVSLSSLVLLAISSSVTLAHADGAYLTCNPKVAEAFTRTSISISPSQGKFSANLNHGGQQSYTVEQLPLDDTTLQVFQGQGFTLIFNTIDDTASLVASMDTPTGTKTVATINLSCTPSEENTHPSVTASNN